MCVCVSRDLFLRRRRSAAGTYIYITHTHSAQKDFSSVKPHTKSKLEKVNKTFELRLMTVAS